MADVRAAETAEQVLVWQEQDLQNSLANNPLYDINEEWMEEAIANNVD